MTTIEIELMVMAGLLGALGMFVWLIDRKLDRILLIAMMAQEAEEQMSNDAWQKQRRAALDQLDNRIADYHDKPPGI